MAVANHTEVLSQAADDLDIVRAQLRYFAHTLPASMLSLNIGEDEMGEGSGATYLLYGVIDNLARVQRSIDVALGKERWTTQQEGGAQ